jgi:hypothetical protein
MADGFLGRWSQRKQALRQGRGVDEPAAVKTKSVDPQARPLPPVEVALHHEVTPEKPGPDAIHATPPTPKPAPTLADVKALNADSSYASFVARDVAPEVRNAAMKKLFTDPHYNLMDGLDIYIDDYSQPDPMPVAMLRQLSSAKFLNLFDEEDTPTPGTPAALLPPQTDAKPETVALSTVSEPASVLSDPSAASVPNIPTDTLPALSAADLSAQEPHHDHTDLRLQPNDATGRPQSERIPE